MNADGITNRRKILPRVRMYRLSLLIVVGLVIGAGPFASISRVGAAESSEPVPLAVLEGTCDDPGDEIAALDDAAPSMGGALTSFTTIDVPLTELARQGAVILAGDSDEPIACGVVGGMGDNLYLSLPAAEGSDLAGIAWLHAREEKTQISVFLGEGLGAAEEGTIEPPDQPEPPSDETPEPEETPTPKSTPGTRGTSSDSETYTSPSYGYTVTYDSSIWHIDEERTEVANLGPLDIFVLMTDDNSVATSYLGTTYPPNYTPELYLEDWYGGLASVPEFSNIDIHVDPDGNPMRATLEDRSFMAIDFTINKDSGRTVDRSAYVVARSFGEPGSLLVMIFDTPRDQFDDLVDLRNDMEAAVSLAE